MLHSASTLIGRWQAAEDKLWLKAVRSVGKGNGSDGCKYLSFDTDNLETVYVRREQDTQDTVMCQPCVLNKHTNDTHGIREIHGVKVFPTEVGYT